MKTGLVDLPADVFTEVAKQLTPLDILSVRKVSKRLSSLSRLRSVWANALFAACIQHGVSRHNAPLKPYSDAELERMACRATRFQVSLEKAAGKESRPSTRPRQEYALPDDHYIKTHLVRGGRWLVSLSADWSLRVWDLEPLPAPSAATTTNPEDKKEAVLYGEGSCPNDSTLLDAYLSDSGHELYVFMHFTTPQESNQLPTSNIVVYSSPMSLQDTRGFNQVASWRSAEWMHTGDTFAVFGGDYGVFGTKEVGDVTWLWNWRSSLSKKIRLKRVHDADQLIRVKFISDDLMVLHSSRNRKCFMTMYAIPFLDLEATPVIEDGYDTKMPPPPLPPSVQHPSIEAWSNSTDKEFIEEISPLFTSKFHGLHHVETYRSKTRPSSSRPSTSSSSSINGFVHRRNPKHSVPFNIGTAVIGEPYWLVPAQPAKAGTASSAFRDRDRGQFRAAIAIESLGEAPYRTRLQYYIRVDLNAIRDFASPEAGGTVVASRASSGSGDQTVASHSSIPYPRLRGRLSSSREHIYFQDRISVVSGRIGIISFWSGVDGLHAHTSSIQKSDDPPPTSSKGKTPQRPSSDRPRISSKVTVRIRDGSGTAMVPVAREPVQVGSSTSSARPVATGASEEYPSMGKDLIIYPWSKPQPEKPQGMELIQNVEAELRAAVAEAAERRPDSGMPGGPGFMGGRRRDLPGNSLAMSADMFSGRVVVLDEVEGTPVAGRSRRTFVRILDYV